MYVYIICQSNFSFEGYYFDINGWFGGWVWWVGFVFGVGYFVVVGVLFVDCGISGLGVLGGFGVCVFRCILHFRDFCDGQGLI